MSHYDEAKDVGRLAEIVALHCGVHPAVARQLRTAAPLHDVGKSKIPSDILEKPGKLNQQEYEIMKNHTVIGAELLKSIQGGLGVMARKIALYHHEWYDGSQGYWGKRTDELPFYVSFVAISDVYIALINERSYKHAWTPEEAVDYIIEQSGAQFNPALVNVFVPLAREFH
jgi:putative two-component system response regulator